MNKLVLSMALLGLVAAILIEEASSTVTYDDKRAALKRAARHVKRGAESEEFDEAVEELAFALLDSNSDGKLTAQEVIDFLEAIAEEGESITEEEKQEFINVEFPAADTNHDGFIDLQEFKAI